MHELSIASSILETVLEKGAGLERIDEVHLSIGCLMMLNPDQLTFSFGLLARGTPAEGARLFFEIAKAKLVCGKGHETTVEIKEPTFDHLVPVMTCAVCGGPTRIVEGKELFLMRIVGE